MPNSDNYYSGGIAMISVDDAEAIALACMAAGRPDRIAEFIGGRLMLGEVIERLQAAAAPVPAAQPAAKTTASIFGGPTAAEQRALAAAFETRFKAMYPKSSG